MAKVFDLDKLKTKQPLKAEQPRARGRKPTRNPFVLVPWEWIDKPRDLPAHRRPWSLWSCCMPPGEPGAPPSRSLTPG